MYEINGIKLYWQSDWCGYEVGYPEIDVVGLYTDGDGNDYYIDVENVIILERINYDDN